MAGSTFPELSSTSGFAEKLIAHDDIPASARLSVKTPHDYDTAVKGSAGIRCRNWR